MNLSVLYNFGLNLKREQTGNFIPNFLQSSNLTEENIISLVSAATVQLSLEIAANGSEQINTSLFNLSHPRLIFVKSNRAVTVAWGTSTVSGKMLLLDTDSTAPTQTGGLVSPTFNISNAGLTKASLSLLIVGYSSEL